MSWYFRHVSALSLTLVLSLPSTRLATAAAAQAAQSESNLTFTVLVYNNAEVSPKTLAKAADLAKKIFRNARLDMVWIEFVPEQPISREKLEQVDCVVRILAEARVVLSRSATGEALPCTLGEVACFANVFFDRVTDQAELGALSQDQMLAHAISHELGHLLLGSDSHFGMGIMKAKWGPEDMQRMAKGDLLFRAEQAATMKANLRNRLTTKAQSFPKLKNKFVPPKNIDHQHLSENGSKHSKLFTFVICRVTEMIRNSRLFVVSVVTPCRVQLFEQRTAQRRDSSTTIKSHSLHG